ncbi:MULTISPECIES: hypothetical protein [Actinoplanes]|uniref:Cell division protein FtsL n=2 Tax=Actinoplanes TaxID=1865 RepID=A0A101JDY1_9ACTN|nr:MULTISPECIES: hypothetical protein [Actinoplanes]KUL24906.1 hypothetical protein ADL15_42230 [Actinoplanes awajinensis subsp. mycoplanecinus]
MRGDEGREQPETVIEVDGTAAKQLKTDGISLPFLPRLRVAPPLPIRAPRPTFAAGVIALVLVGVVGILLINTKTMEQSFRLDALRENQTSLDEQQQELEQQLIQVSGPGNLEAAARQLGLVPAGAPAKIRLPDGKYIGTPRPGQGQTAPTAQDSLTTGGATTGAGADPAAADQNAVGTGQ